MTFCYLPRSIDTYFLVVYEPNRALEGLQGVAFQGKNCLRSKRVIYLVFLKRTNFVIKNNYKYINEFDSTDIFS